jgi:hypothetical protein
LDARQVEEHEFADALAEARKASESDAEADSLLEALLTEGEERVADAVAFAEVLLPMLTEQLRPAFPAAARRADHPRQRTPSTEKPGEVREIADFIDDMLAQDRAGSR